MIATELRCTVCGTGIKSPAEFHPWAFCVLVKAGLDPLEVIREAVRFLGEDGWRSVVEVDPPRRSRRG